MDERMPADFDEEVRFFGRYTWKDLVRLALPFCLEVWLFDLSVYPLPVTVFLLLLGAVTGLAWYVYRPYGKPVDHHLYHWFRWVLNGVFRL